MTATPSRSIQKMSEQLNVVDLNFDNTIIHSCINTFQKEVKDSGLSIKLAHKGDEHYFFKNQRLSISPGEYLLVNRHQSFDCYLNAPQAIEGFCLYLSKNTILDTVKGVRSSQHQLLDYWGEQGEQEPLFLEKYIVRMKMSWGSISSKYGLYWYTISWKIWIPFFIRLPKSC
jgi:hypothetical protein